jgi:hypothetical protein
VARQRLAAVPGAGTDVVALGPSDVPPAPGLPGGDPGAWDALLRSLGARSR